MLAGAVLMVIGSCLYVFSVTAAAPWLFAIGSVAFAAMQMMQTYDGDNVTVRRLRRIMVTGDVLFILSAAFMVENSNHFLLPFFLKSFPKDGYTMYLSYIHNNWVVLLLIAAILELYSTHRISNELDKETKKL